jgi:multiple antibiotic resistance protein
LFDHAFLDFINLFVVFNPTGIVPQYLYFTRYVPPEAKKRLALRCVLIATAILVAFIVLGQLLFDALGIGFPAFSIAGGIVLLVISLRMILEGVGETPGEEKEEVEGWSSARIKALAVFPLATPLIAGPGGILIVMLLTDNHRHDIPERAVTTLMLLVVMVITYLVLLMADKIQRALGVTGINMLSRISGLILAALSVETMLDGVTDRFLV